MNVTSPSQHASLALPFRMRRLNAALILAALAFVCMLVGYYPVAHVQHQFADKTHHTPWVWLDYPQFFETHSPSGSFSGYVRVPDSGKITLENTLGAETTLTLDGQVVYTGSQTTDIDLTPYTTSAVSFVLDYYTIAPPKARGHLALTEAGPFGSQHVIAPWHFATSADHLSDGWLASAARAIGLLLVALAVLMGIASLRLSRSGWLWVIGILALALAARLITLAQKFDNDPTLWTMENIWDNYVVLGRGWLGGSVRVAGNIYQQGMFIYMAALQQVIGPELSGLYIFNTVLGSLVAVLALFTGWALFDHPTGIVAGIIAALFAPLIHYQQTLQIASMATFCVFLLVAGTAALYRWPRIAFAVVIGLAVGVGTVLRSTILVLLPLPALALLLTPTPRRTKLILGGLILVMVALCISPITIANKRRGVTALTANLGDYQMFRSNSLTSTGMNTYMTQSEQLALARREHWRDALRRDIERRPMHLVELTIRRAALFWDPTEHSDSFMIDYHATGQEASSVLNALSLDGAANFQGAMILAFAGLGLGALGIMRRKETLLVGFGLALYIGSLSLFYVIGRVRIPSTGLVLPLAAVGVVGIWRLRTARWRLRLSGAGIVIASIVLSIIANALIGYLPRPTFVSADDLPADLIQTQATYGDELQLLGYAYYDSNFTPGGYLTFELYWKALRRPSADYVVSFRLLNTATQTIDQVTNFELGAVNMPYRTTHQWPQGSIFDERYLITLPTPTDSDLHTYAILVGLYDRASDTLLAVTDANTDVLDNYARLTAVGLTGESAQAAPDDTDLALVWDNAIGIGAPDCRITDDELVLTLDWHVLRRVTQPWHLFVHLSQDGVPVGQQDAPPDEQYPIDGWPPGSTLTTVWTMQAVPTPVTVELGLYDVYSGKRLPISALRDPFTGPDDVAQFTCGAAPAP